MWVHNNIANQNKWYFVGIFCGNGGLDIRQTYVVTGGKNLKYFPMNVFNPFWQYFSV